MSLGDNIDQLYLLRASRISLEREAEDLKKQEHELEQDILNEVKTLGLSSAKGAKASFTTKVEITPIVTEWKDIYDFIVITEDFSLLHKRLSSTAWKELYDGGIIVPGTDKIEIDKTFLRKI